jgi:hypothetical protein
MSRARDTVCFCSQLNVGRSRGAVRVCVRGPQRRAHGRHGQHDVYGAHGPQPGASVESVQSRQKVITFSGQSHVLWEVRVV